MPTPALDPPVLREASILEFFAVNMQFVFLFLDIESDLISDAGATVADPTTTQDTSVAPFNEINLHVSAPIYPSLRGCSRILRSPLSIPER